MDRFEVDISDKHSGDTVIRKLIFSFIFLMVLFVCGITFIALDYNKKKQREQTGEFLKTVLNTTTEGLLFWLSEKKEMVIQVSKEPFLVTGVRHLSREVLLPEEGVNTYYYKLTAEFLRKKAADHKVRGLSLVNDQFGIIVSDREGEAGSLHSVSVHGPATINSVFQGRTVLIPPVSVGGKRGSLFILTPVTDTEGRNLAALVMEIDPFRDFSRIIKGGRIGVSGETYALDRKGVLISESRFLSELQKKGILEEGEDPVLKMKITDPVLNGNGGITYTEMALSVLKEKRGENLVGYRDYRGVEVLGVWHWIDEMGIGLATEIDKSEAMGAYFFLRKTVVAGVFIIIIISAGGILFTVFFSERKHLFLELSRKRLKHIVYLRTEELNKSRDELKAALKEARSSDRAKTRFLTTMDHEVRTPMNSILGFTDVLLDSELDDIQRTYLKTIHMAATSLLSVLSDILDLAKLEDNTLKLVESYFDLPGSLEELLVPYYKKASQKKLRLYFEYDETLARYYLGDFRRILQVLNHLIDNAFKFTEMGSVSLILTPTERHEGIHFCVKDTGVGIPEHKSHLLFHSYSSKVTDSVAPFTGVGMGLVICRRLIESMGGVLRLERPLNGGAAFHFTLPLKQADETYTYFKDGEPQFRESYNLLLYGVPEENSLFSLLMDAGYSVQRVRPGESFPGPVLYNKELDILVIWINKESGEKLLKDLYMWQQKKNIFIPFVVAGVPECEKQKYVDIGVWGILRDNPGLEEVRGLFQNVMKKDEDILWRELNFLKNSINSIAWEKKGWVNFIHNWKDADELASSIRNFLELSEKDVSSLSLKTTERRAEQAGFYHLKNICRELTPGAEFLEDVPEMAKTRFLRGFNDSIVLGSDILDSIMRGRRRLQEDLIKRGGLRNLKEFFRILNRENPDLTEPVLNSLKDYICDELYYKLRLAVTDFDFSTAESLILSIYGDPEEIHG